MKNVMNINVFLTMYRIIPNIQRFLQACSTLRLHYIRGQHKRTQLDTIIWNCVTDHGQQVVCSFGKGFNKYVNTHMTVELFGGAGHCFHICLLLACNNVNGRIFQLCLILSRINIWPTPCIKSIVILVYKLLMWILPDLSCIHY